MNIKTRRVVRNRRYIIYFSGTIALILACIISEFWSLKVSRIVQEGPNCTIVYSIRINNSKIFFNKNIYLNDDFLSPGFYFNVMRGSWPAHWGISIKPENVDFLGIQLLKEKPSDYSGGPSYLMAIPIYPAMILTCLLGAKNFYRRTTHGRGFPIKEIF